MRTEADREEERRRDAWSQSAAMLSTELLRGSCCWTTSSADACGVRAQDALRAAKLGKERASGAAGEGSPRHLPLAVHGSAATQRVV